MVSAGDDYATAREAADLCKRITAPYDGKLVQYLDNVGRMHTPKMGSGAINVPLVQMNALMGFVADAFNATILGFDLPAETRATATRAFSKLLWLHAASANSAGTRYHARIRIVAAYAAGIFQPTARRPSNGHAMRTLSRRASATTHRSAADASRRA